MKTNAAAPMLPSQESAKTTGIPETSRSYCLVGILDGTKACLPIVRWSKS